MASQHFSLLQIQQIAGSASPSYLGTGSFGETWRLDDEAWKILYRPGYDAERLSREVSGLGRVDSDYVVKLRRQSSVTIDGTTYPVLIFDFIDGVSLQEHLETATTRPADDLITTFVERALVGLETLHAANVIHRDLKPENISLRGGEIDRPVLLDLGLAKLLDIDSITRYPTLVGNAMYAAPEQLRGERASRASDLWAIAVVAYEIATGTHPYFRPGELINVGDALARLNSPAVIPISHSGPLRNFIQRSTTEAQYVRGSAKSALRRLRNESETA